MQIIDDFLGQLKPKHWNVSAKWITFASPAFFLSDTDEVF